MDDTRVADIDGLMRGLFAMVADGISRATDAFLRQDRDAARALIASDTEFTTLQDEIEQLVENELSTPGGLPSSDQLHQLVSVLRIVPELERCGDLVEHVAQRAAHGLVETLSPSARVLVGEMGAIGARMWRDAAIAYDTNAPEVADELRRLDDELDDLHVQLTETLTSDGLPTAAAIEMGLLARFYERLGDHAVNVVRRVPALAR